MRVVEQRLPQEYDKSFIVFREFGQFFPCPWHYHPEYELVLVLESTGRRMVGDHIGYFQKDDLVFMGPKLPHVWVNDAHYTTGTSNIKADAIVIQFVKSFLGEEFLRIPEMESLKKKFTFAERGLEIKGAAKTKIIGLMKNMVQQNGLQRLASLFIIFDTLAECTEYDVLASPNYEKEIQTGECSDRFSKITEYIMKNFTNDITLPEIAGVANMGITAFCNFFKKHYQMSFVEYLNKVKIGHACKILAGRDESIAGVAYLSGFDGLANFNRQFKKIKKMTPSEYKRNLQV